ncbi:tetratricopeptide repeat protein [Leucobacter komagatae]|uniref:Thioredoxin n=1 Tax=Leucobacter komagatae TaxID=55969 RepID=A0A0D0IQH5_9MICO|nr:tetratricopeptide repeat protein [Leucobacter komagatae]KIP53839.1 thioredoxin [Leucobacter komagatae]
MATDMPQRIPSGGVDLSHLAQRAGAQQGVPQPGQRGVAPGGAPGQPGAPGQQGAPQTVDVPSLVMDVTDASFEQIAQLSAVVPVVFDLWAEWCEPCKTLSPIIEKVTRELDGRVLLAKVDVDANPGLAQAFQAQSIPTVVAMIGGRPVPLFQGAVPEQEVREFFVRLIQLAEENGVAGRVNAPDAAADDAAAAPAEPQIPEAHVAAFEAAERGDYDTAVREWEAVLQKAPADTDAKAALAQTKLLQRLQGHTLEDIRANAAANTEDLDAQMRVADLDLSGGHIEDSFLRLLDLFAAGDEDARTAIRNRLLELFEVVGVADPRVIAARGKLASLLY